MDTLDLERAREVEELIGAAYLDVALERDRVVGLRERVEQLMQRDGRVRGDALGEVGALEHARERDLGGEPDDVVEGHLAEPLAVAPDLGLVLVEDLEDLALVGGGVGDDL